MDVAQHAVLLGPIRGTVTLADGTEVDVNGEHVVVESAEQAAEVAHLVGLRYQAEGHPLDPPDATFVYEPPEELVDYEPHPDNTTIAPQEG